MIKLVCLKKQHYYTAQDKREYSVIFSFLARLDEVQEELLYYPRRRRWRGQNVKVFYVMDKALSGELSCPCDRSCSIVSLGTCCGPLSKLYLVEWATMYIFYADLSKVIPVYFRVFPLIYSFVILLQILVRQTKAIRNKYFVMTLYINMNL